MSTRGLLVTAALLGAGCSDDPSPAAVAETRPDTAPVATPTDTAPLEEPQRHSTLSNEETYEVSYASEPDPIPVNESFDLRVWIGRSDETLKSGGDLALDVDGRMPEHHHGMNRVPVIEPQPDGSILVSGMLFHMPGRWELYFDCTEGGITERAQFEVVLE